MQLQFWCEYKIHFWAVLIYVIIWTLANYNILYIVLRHCCCCCDFILIKPFMCPVNKAWMPSLISSASQPVTKDNIWDKFNAHTSHITLYTLYPLPSPQPPISMWVLWTLFAAACKWKKTFIGEICEAINHFNFSLYYHTLYCIINSM